jgi:glycosyltransferase involved in cell wall biosynthesis
MNILIIDDSSPNTPYDGKTLRLINIFKRIPPAYKLHYLYLLEPGEKYRICKPLVECFSSHKIIPGNTKEFWPGRIFNIASLKPWFYARWRFRDDYIRVQNEIKNIIETKSINVLHCFSTWTVQYAIDTGIPWIADFCDSHALYLDRQIPFADNIKEQIYMRFKRIRIFNYEREMIRKSQISIFVSNADASLYSDLNYQNKIRVISNGVDSEYYNSNGDIAKEFPSVVFSGHMNSSQNINAVFYFYEKILPIIRKTFPELKFFIVGADPVPEIIKLKEDKNIIVTGAVDDIRYFLNRANIFVCPMRTGTGIKNKLLEAMALGKPVVSTTVGAEAIEVTPNNNIILADEPEQFASEVVKILKDEKKAKIIGNNARALVEQKYSWEATIEKYRASYEELNKMN